MTHSDPSLIPVLHAGVVLTMAVGRPALTPGLTLTGAGAAQILSLPGGRLLIDPAPQDDLVLEVSQYGRPLVGSPLDIQIGGWSGLVEQVEGRLVMGRARNLRRPSEDVAVVAFTPDGQIAFATALAAQGGRFLLLLPDTMLAGVQPPVITLGIAGSDYLLDHGLLTPPLCKPPGPSLATPLLQRRPVQRLATRIKISTPNLKEAPAWGDYHFAGSLCAAFDRLGQQAATDTADRWYDHTEQEDVVLVLRGRHRFRTDPTKINILWLISHPDRIPDAEFADYDHVAVASDIYAAELQVRGLPSVSVLHQAADTTLFRPDPDIQRTPSCLFVGNSRREYRTMVKWCVETGVPFDLYGGGWDGILPPDMIRASSIANKDLAGYYGRHLILLNDHWDSMRDNGFLSNRLFDGSAVGTPIITDRVQGLSEVFGDSIAVAETIADFGHLVRDCLNNPEPWLARAARARAIVLEAHTFDHRAAQLTALIDRIASAKRRR